MRRLADAGFTQTPTLVGLVEWHNPGGDWAPIAVVQEHLAGAEDGWTWAPREARRALGLEPGRPTEFAGALGELTARLHLALADDPTEVTTSELAAAQAVDASGVLDEAVRLTSASDPSSHRLLVEHRAQIEAALAGLSDLAGSPAVPIHGDLHVGQVLRASDGALSVIDFDGNPTRPAMLRAASGPAARDVAGMLVSLENVAHVVCHHAEVADPAALEWASRAWVGHAQGGFLTGYRRALGDRRDLCDEALLPAFDWEQVCREFVYAARHLPAWGYVPAAALSRRTRED
jgi:maltokinase